jgi:hypothetical protein
MLLHTTAATFLAATTAPFAPGQQGEAVNGHESSNFERSECESAAGRERRTCEEERRERRLAALISGVDYEPERWPEIRLPLQQIREDFQYLLAVNGHLSQVASQGDELDFRAVAKSASEIKKRAARLRDSLALPEAEADEKRWRAEVSVEPARLRTALSELSKLITVATRNPVFGGYIFDAARAAEARRDLDEIVELSGRVGKCGERLSKGSR